MSAERLSEGCPTCGCQVGTLAALAEATEKLNKPCANCGFPTDDLLGVSKLRAASAMLAALEKVRNFTDQCPKYDWNGSDYDDLRAAEDAVYAAIEAASKAGIKP